ncbi:MAG: Bpu10I family restriction endonuclease [Gammaproteobacteria bacterium]|nr:Bpu10I family restriction endonuclease [Gammaproteobacteria bacterium]
MVESCIESYREWIAEMTELQGTGDQLVEPLIASLNRYKSVVDFELIFDNDDDFLYRQKGQLKLDNTVLEEFLPWLVGRVFADPLEGRGVVLGPTTAFSQLRFESDVLDNKRGGGMAVRSKDHDFAMARPLFLRASHREDFGDARTERTHLAYVAAEIKTNLDKTMFQEASATAYDLKLALPSSRYFLLCEWLDMTPISTAVTSIEKVIVLRKARRLPADVRRHFATAAGRAENREVFQAHLNDHPFAPDAFRRFLGYVEQLVTNGDQDEDDVLERGWF